MNEIYHTFTISDDNALSIDRIWNLAYGIAEDWDLHYMLSLPSDSPLDYSLRCLGITYSSEQVVWTEWEVRYKV